MVIDMERLLVWIFVMAVFLNEIVLKFSVMIGFFVYVVLLTVSLFVLSREETSWDFRSMILVLLIVPLLRVSELFLDVSFGWKVLLLYSILLFVSIYYLILFDIDFIGKVRSFWFIPFVLVFGFLFGVVGSLFGVVLDSVLISFMPLIIFSEEVFFRGLLQNVLTRVCGTGYSLLVPALLYGILTISFGFWFGLFCVLVGFVSGLIYHYGKSIFLCVLFDFVFFGVVFVL